MQRTLLFEATEGPKVPGVTDSKLELEKVQGIKDALMFTIIDGGMQMVFIGREDLIRLRNVLSKHIRTLTA